jgi:hypothetical protein
VGVAADYADVVVRRMDQLHAHPRMAAADRRAYAVHQKKLSYSQFRCFGFLQNSGQELVKQILVHCTMQGTGNCIDKFCYFSTSIKIKSGMVDVICLICVAGCRIRPDVLQDNAWTIPSERDLSGH